MTLGLINRAIMYLLFIQILVIHRRNVNMHAYINYSHWSLGLIFSLALACGYSSPNISLEAKLGARSYNDLNRSTVKARVSN